MEEGKEQEEGKEERAPRPAAGPAEAPRPPLRPPPPPLRPRRPAAACGLPHPWRRLPPHRRPGLYGRRPRARSGGRRRRRGR